MTRRTLAPDLIAKPARSPWSIAVSRFRRSKLAMFGVVMIALMTLATIFADVIAPYGENEIDLFNITAQPSEAHVLGTDELGRDELSRLIFGGRISLSVGGRRRADLDGDRDHRRGHRGLLRGLARHRC